MPEVDEPLCEICGHPPCPGCVDDCDHRDCMKPGPEPDSLVKTHVCVYPPEVHELARRERESD